MNDTARQTWSARLDKICGLFGALVPAGIVTGNTAFEAAVAGAALAWLVRVHVARNHRLYRLAEHPMAAVLVFWYAAIVFSLLELIRILKVPYAEQNKGLKTFSKLFLHMRITILICEFSRSAHKKEDPSSP